MEEYVMKVLEKYLIEEVDKLNKMIEARRYELIDDIILEQSMKVDKIIVMYEKSKWDIAV
jgi:hypothetical protein